jgi:hypothetical protein
VCRHLLADEAVGLCGDLMVEVAQAMVGLRRELFPRLCQLAVAA